MIKEVGEEGGVHRSCITGTISAGCYRMKETVLGFVKPDKSQYKCAALQSLVEVFVAAPNDQSQSKGILCESTSCHSFSRLNSHHAFLDSPRQNPVY
jgi:hypothetical protein